MVALGPGWARTISIPQSTPSTSEGRDARSPEELPITIFHHQLPENTSPSFVWRIWSLRAERYLLKTYDPPWTPWGSCPGLDQERAQLHDAPNTPQLGIFTRPRGYAMVW